MKPKPARRLGEVAARAGIRIPLIVWSIVVLYPLFWMVMGAFKSNAEIFASPWALPEVFNYQNFIQAWTDYNIGTSFFNSLIVTCVRSAVNVAVGRAHLLCPGKSPV